MPAPSTQELPIEAPGGGAPQGPRRFIGNADPGSTELTASRLHLGCGQNQIVGWTNIDGDDSCQPDMVLDFRRSFPFETASIDRIYSEHLFEHFTLEEGMMLLAECFRVLKPGGVMRTAMPDLQSSVIHYLNSWQDQEWVTWFPEIDSPARALNMALRSWGHQYVYDFADFSMRLRQVGFTTVEKAKWGVSRYPDLCGLETRKESELLVEAIR